jgi:L-cysteine desulfidase
MSGVDLPVMIATGSGNQGITLFLTVAAAAEKLRTPPEKLLRGLVLALGVNLLSKAYLGTLAPICACGVASGIGASVGIVYIQEGSIAQMMGAIRSMIGSIAGMICDGAKEGCANKVAISAAAAALSAMTAVSDFSISQEDGILAEDIHDLFGNLEYIAKKGMEDTNRAIIRIMSGKSSCSP